MLYGKIGSYGITEELLIWLKESFPDRLPPKKTTIEDLRFLQGQQNIIEVLESKFNTSTQSEENVDTTINILSRT